MNFGDFKNIFLKNLQYYKILWLFFLKSEKSVLRKPVFMLNFQQTLHTDSEARRLKYTGTVRQGFQQALHTGSEARRLQYAGAVRQGFQSEGQ